MLNPSVAAEMIVPIEQLFYADSGPHVFPAARAESESGIVPIETLLFRSDRALQRAMSLRPAFERLADSGIHADPEIREQVAELFDLLELSRSPAVEH